MLQRLAAVQVSIRIEDAPAFMRAAGDAGWSAVDSGLRVTTEDGVDKEAIILLRIPVVGEIGSAAT